MSKSALRNAHGDGASIHSADDHANGQADYCAIEIDETLYATDQEPGDVMAACNDLLNAYTEGKIAKQVIATFLSEWRSEKALSRRALLGRDGDQSVERWAYNMIWRSFPNVVRVLVALGAHEFARDECGAPLSINKAVCFFPAETVKILLEVGLDPNVPDMWSIRPSRSTSSHRSRQPLTFLAPVQELITITGPISDTLAFSSSKRCCAVLRDVL